MIQQTAHLLLLVVASAPSPARSFDDVSRAYRIETYNSFRLERPEFNRRQRLGVEAANRWKEARFDKDLQSHIVEWFTKSTDATKNGKELPTLPGETSLASKREAARQARARAAAKAAKSASSPVPETQPTSIVTNERLVANQDPAPSETVKILGSVGRAVTNAFVKSHGLNRVKPSVKSADFVGAGRTEIGASQSDFSTSESEFGISEPEFGVSESEDDGPTADELRAIFDGDA